LYADITWSNFKRKIGLGKPEVLPVGLLVLVSRRATVPGRSWTEPVRLLDVENLIPQRADTNDELQFGEFSVQRNTYDYYAICIYLLYHMTRLTDARYFNTPPEDRHAKQMKNNKRTTEEKKTTKKIITPRLVSN